MGRPSEVRGAVQRAVEAGDAQGLRALLSSPERDTISRCSVSLPATAAVKGEAQCLRVFAEFGFKLDNNVWAAAATEGHVNCLAFAVSHGYTLEDIVFVGAVFYGQLACVNFLLQHGLPREPYVHSVYRTEPGQLECLQLMLDKGVAIDPQTLILAASRGDVDFVRWLHQRGVPLWREARDARHKSFDWVYGCPVMSETGVIHQKIYQWETVEGQPEPPGRIAIPWESTEREAALAGEPAGTWDPCDLESTWKALRYGAVFGAPVTLIVERVFAKKRERTHAVLLCFKAAARLSTGPACGELRRIWAGMAVLPSSLVEELLILADLEIPECIRPRLVLAALATAP